MSVAPGPGIEPGIGRLTADCLTAWLSRKKKHGLSENGSIADAVGRGGRDRTFEWRIQRPLPYRLATPLCYSWVIPESNRARRVKSPLLHLGANDPWDVRESNPTRKVKSQLLHLGANVPLSACGALGPSVSASSSISFVGGGGIEPLAIRPPGYSRLGPPLPRALPKTSKATLVYPRVAFRLSYWTRTSSPGRPPLAYFHERRAG